MFKEIEHTADLAILVEGKTLEELFLDAAKGMFFLIYNKKDYETEKKFETKIELTSFDYETLLVDWLSELLYLNYNKNFRLINANLIINNFNLKAEIIGDFDNNKEKIIKAITFHELDIIKVNSCYQTKIIFDV